jgi:hypothetical protein
MISFGNIGRFRTQMRESPDKPPRSGRASPFPISRIIRSFCRGEDRLDAFLAAGGLDMLEE